MKIVMARGWFIDDIEIIEATAKDLGQRVNPVINRTTIQR